MADEIVPLLTNLRTTGGRRPRPHMHLIAVRTFMAAAADDAAVYLS